MPRVFLRFLLLGMLLAGSWAGASFGQGLPNIYVVDPVSGTLAFGDVRMFVTSPTQSITVGSDGGSDLTISSFVRFGSIQYLMVAPDVPQTLMPAETTDIAFSTDASSVGEFTGSLSITSNDPASPLVVLLTATGVRSYINLSSTADIDFGNVEAGTSSGAMTVTVSNQNMLYGAPLNATLAISPVSAEFNVSPSTITDMAPGGSQSVSVYFAPETEGAQTGILTILSDDPFNPTYSINLGGAGTAASMGGGPGAAPGGGSGGCLIETVAAGSYLAGSLDDLRALRDRIAHDRLVGARLVAAYYALSRNAADWLRGHEAARTAARWSLTPVVMAALHPFAAMLLLCGALLMLRFVRHR